MTEIDAALTGVKRRGLDWVDITREDFPLPAFASELAKIAQELETGRGMTLLRGLLLAYSPDDLRTVCWGIGANLGTAVSQGGRGEVLANVEDEGKDVEITRRRGARPRTRCSFMPIAATSRASCACARRYRAG